MKCMPPDFVPVPPLTEKQKREAYAYWGRKCVHRGCHETEGLEIDHIIPRGLGGTNDLKNTRPKCQAHHSEKTHKQDRPMIRKADRLHKKAQGVFRKPKVKINSPGFSKAKRPFPRSRGFE